MQLKAQTSEIAVPVKLVTFKSGGQLTVNQTRCQTSWKENISCMLAI